MPDFERTCAAAQYCAVKTFEAIEGAHRPCGASRLTKGEVMSTTSLAARWRSWAPYLLSILRIVAAFVFVQYGSAKLLAIPAAIMPGGGTAPLTSLPGVAGALELTGGTLLLVGLFTRP